MQHLLEDVRANVCSFTNQTAWFCLSDTSATTLAPHEKENVLIYVSF